MIRHSDFDDGFQGQVKIHSDNDVYHPTEKEKDALGKCGILVEHNVPDGLHSFLMEYMSETGKPEILDAACEVGVFSPDRKWRGIRGLPLRFSLLRFAAYCGSCECFDVLVRHGATDGLQTEPLLTATAARLCSLLGRTEIAMRMQKHLVQCGCRTEHRSYVFENELYKYEGRKRQMMHWLAKFTVLDADGVRKPFSTAACLVIAEFLPCIPAFMVERIDEEDIGMKLPKPRSTRDNNQSTLDREFREAVNKINNDGDTFEAAFWADFNNWQKKVT